MIKKLVAVRYIDGHHPGGAVRGGHRLCPVYHPAGECHAADTLGRRLGPGVRRGQWVSDAVTKLLGMTQEQIYTERQAGKTLAAIAKEKGITDQQLIDAMTAGQKQVIEQAVKDGRLTQAQSDWMLGRMKAMMPFMLNNPFTPGQWHGGVGAGGHGSMMRGGMRGWAPQQAPTAPAAPGTGS